jgi:5'-3' exonuclease
MKKIYKYKCAQISTVNEEFVFLRRKCDVVLLQTQNQQKHQIESYKAPIKDLEEWVQTLQKEKPPFVISSADNDTLKFIEAYVQSIRKECRQLKEELEAQSMCSLLNNETLSKTQLELQRKEVELIQAKVQIMELQGLLNEKKEMLED